MSSFMSRRLASTLLLLLPGLFLAGCSTAVVRRKVERRVARRLNTLLGPADSYHVSFGDTPDAELVRGRARLIDVVGRNIRVKNQFLVDSLHLRLVDVRYEGAEPYFVSIRRSDLDVEFTQDAINQYLQQREAQYQPVLQFEPDRVRVRMVYPFLGKSAPVEAAGYFEIEEGRRLLFRAEEARVPFILQSQPRAATQFVEQQLNPLLDLGKLEFPARLESIQILQGHLRAVGAAALPHENRD